MIEMKVAKPHHSKDIGERIADLRHEKGMLQKDLAAIAGYDQCSISNWEHGVRNLPLHALMKFAEVFEVTSSYILGEESRQVVLQRQAERDELLALRRVVSIQKSELEHLKAGS